MKTTHIYIVLLCFITAFTSCTDNNQFDPDKNYLLLTGTEVNPIVAFLMDDTPSTHYVSTSSTRKVAEDILITYEVDKDALKAYNEKNKTTYALYPESDFQLLSTQDTIYADKAASSGIGVQIVSTENWVEGLPYVIPVTIKSISGEGVELMHSSKTIFLRVSRKMSFSSLNISNANLYSQFMFEKSFEGFELIELPQFTCEVKVYLNTETPGSPQRIRRLCNWGGQEQNMLRFGESGMDRDQLQWVNPGGSIPSKKRFAPETWYTITLTYDGNKYILYVDGVKDTEAPAGKEFGFSFFEIGMSWTSYTNSQRTEGRMAEVKLWDRALVSSEILLGMCGIDPETAEGLIGYWKMDENQGHIFHDSSKNGYHMNWADTWRSPQENGILVQYNKSSYVGWIKDGKNECYQ